MELALSAHKSRSVKESICNDGIGYEQIWNSMRTIIGVCVEWKMEMWAFSISHPIPI